MEDEHADWTPYQKMEAGILKDISHDTDTILDKLEDMNMGGGAAEIRHDPGRSGEDQEGLSSGQKTE